MRLIACGIWLPQTGWQFAGFVVISAVAAAIVLERIALIVEAWRHR